METLKYRLEKEIPILADVDLLVVGMGPGGLCAAVTAARQGLTVTAAEHYGSPGGMANVGEISPFMPNHCGSEPLDRPLYIEWVNRMRNYLASPPPPTAVKRGDDRSIPRYYAMLATEDMLLEAGVKLFYHHTFFDVVKEGKRISAMIFTGKSGLSAIRAKMVIDSTGDGDVAAGAGCDFEFGNADGYCQPMTLCFKLSHVDRSRTPDHRTISELYCRAKEAGKIDCPREDVLFFSDFDGDVVHFNTTRVIQHDGTNAEELSEAEIIARKQMREFLVFLRASVPGYEQAEIQSVASQIGVRESRRILGLEYLTIEAFERRAKFPDAIARVNYPVDIHNPSGSGTDLRMLGADEYYEIPYGCIVPPSVENLLMGCRAISVDHALHSSMRVMPPVCSIGQAAGMAAAMALKAGCNPAELEGSKVRAALKEFGANL
ncbi:FAD-dependent oxidoreductase [uncultured Victivallis sp.]|uniref:FAD-dependent oxidoreductase n=1 Tax=uncultured Victivallis sp. TaxID=354118 RepID=UPI0025D51549|nr:FAD-dependent oxidoreductase [uncultured Victivallis sp.]